MKKIITLCLSALACANASAQYIYSLPDPDTLKVTMNTGATQRFLSTDIADINFSDPKKIVVNTYINQGEGLQAHSYFRNSLKDLRFSSRYSDPTKLLTTGHFGAYEGLFFANNDYSNTYYLYACLASDEMLGGGGLQDHWARYDFLAGQKVNFSAFERLSYEAVAQINKLIKLAEQQPDYLDKKVVDHTKGEMLFLRAYHHYELASLFENIQIITDNDSWEQKNKTYTPAEIWGYIMLDLKNAINLMDGSLCPSLKEDGRVSRYAAEAMLARAFLFYTGFYQGKHDISKENASVTLPDGTTLTKQQVIEYLVEVISQSPFKLVDDFRNLWPYTNRYTVEENPETANQGLKWVEDDGAINPEVLFKIRYNTKATWNSYESGYSNFLALTFGHRQEFYYNNAGDSKNELFPIGNGWGAAPVAPNLFKDWETAEPNDMRCHASIQNLSTIEDYDIHVYADDNAQKTAYHEKKISPIIGKDTKYYNDDYYRTFELMMFHENGRTNLNNDFQGGSIHPLNLIRFADVLLMHSELTGTVDGINEVRRRAGLGGINTYSLKALQQERRWELAFEGVRWNDMRRWGDDYCKQALDRQLNQPIVHAKKDVENSGSLFGLKNYSQQYAETHGFIKPAGGNIECQKTYDALDGQWTFGAIKGISYGTLKYKGVSAEDFISHLEGMIKGYSIDEMKQQVKAAEGEVSEFAHMVINGNNILRISALGDTIQGTITLQETKDYDWRICAATVSDGAIPGSNGCKKFDIIKLDDTLVLVDATSEKTNEEVQFWIFRKATSNDQIMYSLVNKKWSYAVSRGMKSDETGNYWGTYGFSGPWGYGGYVSNMAGISVPNLYCRQIDGTLPNDLAAKASSWGITDTRDADPYAYMEFNLVDKTVSKFTRDGQLIATGQFEWNPANARLTVHNNATLFPYSYYGEGETVENFYLRYSSYSDGAPYFMSDFLGFIEDSGDPMWTFWTFQQRGILPEEIDDQVVISQFDKNNNPAADGCYFKVSFKDGDNRKYGFECIDGTRILTFDGYSRVKAEPGTICQKDIRVWTVNCNYDTLSVTRTLTFNMDTKPSVRFYIYGEPGSGQAPFSPGAWDAAAMRFSDNEGRFKDINGNQGNLPYLSDDIYWGFKTLIFDISDATDDCYGRVMNAWWSCRYDDDVDVHFTNGLWELPLTEEIAKDCAQGNGGGGRDLDIMITSGSCIINAVYYDDER